MKKVIFSVVILGLIGSLGCGKKNSYTPPEFNLKSMDITPEGLANNTPITRSNTDSGPIYKMIGSSPDITKIDKNLICGPVSLSAKTVLATDPNAFNIQISDAQFPGLNQLPMNPHCILQVTAENSNGSQFTKNLSISLKFDTQALVHVTRFHAERGDNQDINGETPLDSYQIQNTQKLPVNFIYKPLNYYAEGICLWSTEPIPPAGPYRNRIPEFQIRADRIEFDPPTLIPTGNINVGLHFTVNGGETVTVTAYGLVPAACGETRTASNVVPGRVLNMGSKRVFDYAIHQIADGLFQQKDFTPTDDDLINPLAATINDERKFPNTRRDDATVEEIMAIPIK